MTRRMSITDFAKLGQNTNKPPRRIPSKGEVDGAFEYYTTLAARNKIGLYVDQDELKRAKLEYEQLHADRMQRIQFKR